MSDYLRDDGFSIISIFIIDRAAVGYGYDMIRGEFESNFGIPLSRDSYENYLIKYHKEIEARRLELREMVYNSGAYSKLINISDTLYELIKKGGAPKEIASLAATLRGYLETMSNLGSKREVNVIKQQNNFLIFKDLESEGVIQIKNPKKLKYLVDGSNGE